MCKEAHILAKESQNPVFFSQDVSQYNLNFWAETIFLNTYR